MVSDKELKNISNIMRRDSLVMTSEAGSGHPTSCMSCAEIISCLFFEEMSYDTKNAFNPDNDEFILSKGHAAPILYSALKHSGCIDYDLKSLRKLKSPLEGHPVPHSLDWIKVATGSLGQGLGVGAGMALAMKMQKRKSKVYVLMGDSELAEGSIYEALNFAAHYKINNLIAIADINRLGQTGETMFGYDIKSYEKKFKSFGWDVFKIDGHDIKQIKSALKNSRNSKNPTMILAKTVKGKGVSFLENKNGWHGKPVPKDQLENALYEIPEAKMPRIKIKRPSKTNWNPKKSKVIFENYNGRDEIATRESYGKALLNLAKSDEGVIVIDSEVGNSTKSELVKDNEKTKKQFVENYIAEQNMISVALGMSKKGFNVFASTFAAFLTRAHDQIRMSAISSANMNICGSHAGVSIGEDGASQMGLEDISLFRDLPDSKVFYPSDAVSTEKLVYLSNKLKGIKYIRTTRPKTPVLYKDSEIFNLGDFKILKQSGKDKAVLVGAGITLHESLKAYGKLKDKGVNVAVVDLYCIKPFNSQKFVRFVKKHGGRIIVAEDHYKSGGIGEMISDKISNSEIKMEHLFVKGIPHSGTKGQLLKKYKIDSKAIVESFIKLGK